MVAQGVARGSKGHVDRWPTNQAENGGRDFGTSSDAHRPTHRCICASRWRPRGTRGWIASPRVIWSPPAPSKLHRNHNDRLKPAFPLLSLVVCFSPGYSLLATIFLLEHSLPRSLLLSPHSPLPKTTRQHIMFARLSAQAARQTPRAAVQTQARRAISVQVRLLSVSLVKKVTLEHAVVTAWISGGKTRG